MGSGHEIGASAWEDIDASAKRGGGTDDDARRQSAPVQCEAGVATAVAGVVLLDGPGPIAAAMTPEAARATAEQLARAAREALTPTRRESGAKDGDAGETAQ